MVECGEMPVDWLHSRAMLEKKRLLGYTRENEQQ